MNWFVIEYITSYAIWDWIRQNNKALLKAERERVGEVVDEKIETISTPQKITKAERMRFDELTEKLKDLKQTLCKEKI